MDLAYVMLSAVSSVISWELDFVIVVLLCSVLLPIHLPVVRATDQIRRGFWGL